MESGEKACEVRGREWSEAATAKEHVEPPGAPRGRKGSPPGPRRGLGPANNLISHSGFWDGE